MMRYLPLAFPKLLRLAGLLGWFLLLRHSDCEDEGKEMLGGISVRVSLEKFSLIDAVASFDCVDRAPLS